jgi:2-Cys peroxiredoxin 5
MVELFKDKRVCSGVAGTFSWDCSKTHFPGFVEQAEALRAKGM